MISPWCIDQSIKKVSATEASSPMTLSSESMSYSDTSSTLWSTSDSWSSGDCCCKGTAPVGCGGGTSGGYYSGGISPANPSFSGGQCCCIYIYVWVCVWVCKARVLALNFVFSC